jgi:tetratricopeptide (TPR) repeat protein
MSLVLALLAAQLGPQVTPGAAPPLPHQTRIEERRAPRRASPAQPEACPDPAEMTPGEAVDAASAWLAEAKGADRAAAGECLGIALARQDDWDEAHTAFLTACEAAADKMQRARLGAMAGEAALSAGDPQAALGALDAAASDAGDGDATLTGGIALFRARALVALKREAEAEAPLAQARAAAPDNATAWLLSATLSRRLNKLAEAQAQIEKAAELRPIDPAIGLEAGLIAVLAGHDGAARKSWQSVMTAAPGSVEADIARGYLAQIDPQSAEPPSR